MATNTRATIAHRFRDSTTDCPPPASGKNPLLMVPEKQVNTSGETQAVPAGLIGVFPTLS